MEDQCFSEEFVENLSPDNVEAWGQILERLRNIAVTRDCYPSVYGFLLSFAGARGLPVHLPAPTYQPERDMLQLADLIESLEKRIGPGLDRRKTKEAVGRAQDFYQTRIRGAFAYEFLESDYKRLKGLVSEIRILTRESRPTDVDHKRRLMKRIAKLQQALHKRVSSLDVFWGLVGDAGVVLGKFGSEAEPLAQRICEILKIVLRTQARAEGLPPATENPLLSGLAQMGPAREDRSLRALSNPSPLGHLITK
jgi:hypothetical protein